MGLTVLLLSSPRDSRTTEPSKGTSTVFVKTSIRNTQIFSLLLAGTMFASAITIGAQSRGRAKKTRPPANEQSTTRPNPLYDQAVKLGDEARLADRLDEAAEHYVKALRIRPKWVDGWWYIAAIFYEKDRFAEARDSFRNVVALDPARGPAWGMLGLCEFQTRDYERAIISLQRGRSLGLGGNPELESVVRYHTALLYVRFEQFEIAYDILAEFYKVGNDSPKVIEAFGLVILRLPFLASEVPPDKREQVLLAGRAGFNMAARRIEETRSAFEQLMAKYPNTPNVHYAFGVFLMNQDADAGLKEFQRELEISPNHQPAIVQMAFEYLKRDDYNTALPLAEKAVQLAPKMFPARNVLGRILLELGQVDRAIKELEEGTRLAPTSAEMHYALGRAYRRAGREAEAKREVALFQKLQEQYNARRDAQLTGSGTENNQPKVKP
jgi:tetratricopeptide (TPR) repeat protein